MGLELSLIEGRGEIEIRTSPADTALPNNSLVNPGENPSPHLHQIVGGNAFNQTMDPNANDLPSTATCTSCTPIDDFSNYWTATLFFRYGTPALLPLLPLPTPNPSLHPPLCGTSR